MKRIDLACLLLSPALVGAVMTWSGTAAGIALICGYNLLVWLPECLLLRYAQASAPVLR
jgi:hypothetical protein